MGANELVEFEEGHLARYVKLVQDEGIDCDLHVTRGPSFLFLLLLQSRWADGRPLAMDVYFNDDDAEGARRSFELRRRDHPESVTKADIKEMSDPAELEKITGVKGGRWGVSYPAGHLWPYKLASGRE